LSVDLQETGFADGAAHILSDPDPAWDWFAIGFILQGEDVDTNATMVSTIIDNVRFTRAVPDPSRILDAQIAGTGVALTWESLANAKYDILFADDPVAGDWASLVEGVAGRAGTTTATGTLQGAMAAYRVEWKPLFFDDFEGVDQWTHGAAGAPGTVWERGAPGVGPAGAFSGSTCWGTDLDGYYTNDVSSWLRSPVIDLVGVTAATLSFQQFRDLEADYDYGYVHILDTGGNPLATNLVAETPILPDETWVKHTVSLPPEALNTNILLEFRLVTDNYNAIAFAGWYIDDVAVTGD
jgi:hypothetical protein